MIHQIVVPQFSKMLGNLLAILNEGAAYAEANGFEFEVLLQARLAPNQFNLTRQVQIACDGAKMAAARLVGKADEAPSHADIETSLVELDARIMSVVAYLNSFSKADFADAADRLITQPRWQGKTLSGSEFLNQYAVPNFYFHVTTAYAILRHNGVPIGKKHYLGALPYKE